MLDDQRSSIAFHVLVSNLILVVGIYSYSGNAASLLVFLALYAITLSHSLLSAKIRLERSILVYELLALFVSSVLLLNLSSVSSYLLGLLILVGSSLFSKISVMTITYVGVQTCILLSADDFQWLSIFALSILLAFLFLINIHKNTSSKFSEAAKKLSEAEVERVKLRSLVNSMGDGVISINPEGIIESYNGAALDILDTNRSIEGLEITSTLGLLDKDENKVDLLQIARDRNGYIISRDYRISQGPDQYEHLYVAVSPVKLGFGKNEHMIGYIIILRDITKEKSLEEERDEFISVVSHELRTPITIAEGNISNAQLMLEKSGAEIDSNAEQAIEDAHKQVVFLADMINDLSTLSRADRGVLKVDPVDINVNELMDSLYRNYEPEAKGKGLDLKTEVEDNIKLFSSQLYVREILQNFITNSIKYTQKGFIKIKAAAKDDIVIFEVIDSGIGISKTDQKKLFNKFFRSEDFRTRESSGTGLGLYVTLKLIKIIGAEIEVESELNKGSTFRIKVPNYQTPK